LNITHLLRILDIFLNPVRFNNVILINIYRKKRVENLLRKKKKKMLNIHENVKTCWICGIANNHGSMAGSKIRLDFTTSY